MTATKNWYLENESISLLRKGGRKGSVLDGIVFITILLNFSLTSTNVSMIELRTLRPDCPRLIVPPWLPHRARHCWVSNELFPLFFLLSFFPKGWPNMNYRSIDPENIIFLSNGKRCDVSRQFVGLISQSSYETRTPLRDLLREDLLSLFEHVETVYTGWRKRKEDDLKRTK